MQQMRDFHSFFHFPEADAPFPASFFRAKAGLQKPA